MGEMESALDQLNIDLNMEVGKGNTPDSGFARSGFFFTTTKA
jgi:hypothetical protein